ncbi:cytochrome C [Pseudomonas sp. G11-1]|uniref:C-type cytochrome n=1 Tax=Halopseudomonas bauzanensis TaxID=653930 RepID=A0A4U0YNE7_9GAMM|nr:MULTISPECIES: c-type cytochrome [Halopseudomonas]MCO5787006.1 cytochrome C [Pseudomonas sp. G11-1]MCO5790232.1 cytochrome C [Pseudomonas sp. G11-2]EZQ18131.1 cytochrome C [Halopseudomonas bauzanensis]TKA92898.1 c-type cytochrome [Halopseudomonas bauzanensis]WGK61627.1 c-type cytochrome [Halopseudomonas sp. SMJS2]
MNNRQARIFAWGSTIAAAVLFLGLTLDSHRQFPELTNADTITPQVTHGKDVWHKYNCINCHTLFGEGAYYAPDLTKITQHRGEAYLQAYMRDPSAFYDEQTHRRLMPQQNLSEEEITDLIQFLDWVANVDNQDWPPRPILVTGGFTAVAGSGGAGQAAEVQSGSTSVGVRPVDADDDIRALGENVFRTAVPGCVACHSLTPGADGAGPSLAGVATRAELLVGEADYSGQASDIEGYLRESILEPSAHLSTGGMYSANGVSFMPDTYGNSLSEEQIEQLVAFLATLK